MTEQIKDYYKKADDLAILGLQVLHAGRQVCSPGHYFGYTTRAHYLIHYVISGKGEYHVHSRVYHLQAGDGFLIQPNVSTFYKASDDDPWTYRWVGFNGTAARPLLAHAGLTGSSLVFHYDKDDFLTDCFAHLMECCRDLSVSSIVGTGYLLLLLGRLQGQIETDKAKPQAGKRDYFSNACFYIRQNYMRDLKVTDIADYLSLDRSQVYRIFEQEVHISPKQYLTNYRLDCAGILICTTDMSFHEIASMVGFEYPSHFFRCFKEHFGLTPSEYKASAGGS
ncbi:MAG: AraC family ligand binding domain-containing protein [Oscillospiraceae bacterium]|jgi:AraC-like DNA-binding protein|nr:AraC family ligand binding domain-containing protein [Oscillospiraceae bacterium]MDD3260821.1 AraC family ligand binding domain-containing protein [Oscillospiraceae bacterium]